MKFTTIQEAKEHLKHLRERSNNEVALGGYLTSTFSEEERDKRNEEIKNQEHLIFQTLLNDFNLYKHVTNVTITFQAMGEVVGIVEPEKFFPRTNYDLEIDLEKRFPFLICDSESGQGWCYTNANFALEVIDFLRQSGKAKDVYLSTCSSPMLLDKIGHNGEM